MIIQQQRRPSPKTYRVVRAASILTKSGPKSVRISIQQPSRCLSRYDDSKQFIHASSQTDLFLEETILSSLKPENPKQQSQSQQINQQRFSPYQIRSKLLIRSQNRNKIVSVVVVNNAGQFIQYLLNSDYFEQSSDHFFSSHQHSSFYLSSATISSQTQQNCLSTYQEILMVHKKSRIYDHLFNRLTQDFTQGFATQCPDLVIVSVGSLSEELQRRRKNKPFTIQQAASAMRESVIMRETLIRQQSQRIQKRLRIRLKDIW